MEGKDCVFCKIAVGEIESHKVYEDESVLAFLDANPINPGHTLVIPKNHVDEFQDMSEDLYSHVMDVVQIVARKIKEVLTPPRVGLWVEGFEVPHAHIHTFPLNAPSDISVKRRGKLSDKEMADIANRLKS